MAGGNPKFMQRTSIRLIKGAHSLIFVSMALCVLYTLYCGVTGKRNRALAWAVGTIALEGVVWFGFGRRCPLTIWAKALGDETGNDYLADWFVPRDKERYVVPSLTTVFLVGLALVLGRWGWQALRPPNPRR